MSPLQSFFYKVKVFSKCLSFYCRLKVLYFLYVCMVVRLLEIEWVRPVIRFLRHTSLCMLPKSLTSVIHHHHYCLLRLLRSLPTWSFILSQITRSCDIKYNLLVFCSLSNVCVCICHILFAFWNGLCTFSVIYFTFTTCLSVLALVATIFVMYVGLRDEDDPVHAMSPWVCCTQCYDVLICWCLLLRVFCRYCLAEQRGTNRVEK